MVPADSPSRDSVSVARAAAAVEVGDSVGAAREVTRVVAVRLDDDTVALMSILKTSVSESAEFGALALRVAVMMEDVCVGTSPFNSRLPESNCSHLASVGRMSTRVASSSATTDVGIVYSKDSPDVASRVPISPVKSDKLSPSDIRRTTNVAVSPFSSLTVKVAFAARALFSGASPCSFSVLLSKVIHAGKPFISTSFNFAPSTFTPFESSVSSKSSSSKASPGLNRTSCSSGTNTNCLSPIRIAKVELEPAKPCTSDAISMIWKDCGKALNCGATPEKARFAPSKCSHEGSGV